MSENNNSQNEIPKTVLALVGMGFIAGALFVLSDASGLEKDSFTKALVAVLFAVGIGAIVLLVFPHAKSSKGEIEHQGAKFTVAGGVAVIAGVLVFIYATTSNEAGGGGGGGGGNDDPPEVAEFMWETYCSICVVRDSWGNPLLDVNGNFVRPTGVGFGTSAEAARQSAASNCQSNGGDYNSCMSNAWQVSP